MQGARPPARGRGSGQFRQGELVRQAGGLDPLVDDLDRRGGIGEGVEPLVERVKIGDERSQGAFRHRAAARHGQLHPLLLVAHVRRAVEPAALGRNAVGFEATVGLMRQFREDRLGGSGVEGAGALQAGHREVVAQVRRQQADSAENAGKARHKQACRVELAHEFRAVDGTRAAEGREREIARIEAAFHRHHLQRPGHVGVDQIDNALRGGDEVHAERFRNMLANRIFGGVGDQGDLAIEQGGRDASEHQIGVGDGRPLSPLAVTRRARIGAGAFRAGPDRALFGDGGDGPAAGADGVNVDHRECERVVADPARGRERGLAVPDERNIGAGAAHVDGQEVVDAGGPSQPGRPLGAGGGARKREMHGASRGLFGRAGAAIRLHHQERRFDGAMGEAGGKPADIAPDHRLHRGVQRGRHGAFVFPKYGKDIDGKRDFDIRQARAENIARPALMGLVGIGVQQDHGDRIEAGGADGFRGRLDRGLVQRRGLRSVDADPARHLEDVAGLHGTFRLDPGEEVGRPRDFGPADFQHMAEALCRDQAGAGALALQDRVGNDGRTVQDGRDFRRAGAGPVQHLVHAAEEAVGGGARHRGRLGDVERTAGAIRQNDVGEGASDIEAERVARGHGPPITGSVWPVIQSARSEARNSTAWAMSSGLPSRRMAMPSMIAACSSGLRASHCRT